jgi:hypothetical protein
MKVGYKTALNREPILHEVIWSVCKDVKSLLDNDLDWIEINDMKRVTKCLRREKKHLKQIVNNKTINEFVEYITELEI